MKPYKTTVERLAHEAHLSLDDVRLTLMVGGIDVESSDLIPKGQFKKARHLLGLSDTPNRKNFSDISAVAQKVGIPEDSLRVLLVEKDLLHKKRLKRIPKKLALKAEKLVKELKTPPPIPKEPESVKLTNIHKIKEPKVKRRTKEPWQLIGPTQEYMSYLTPADASDIHWILVEDFKNSKDPIEPPGIRSDSLLASALTRPMTSLGSENKYPSIAMAGAALLHSIIHNHPFHNGNKRTALVALLVFLDKNGWILTMNEDLIFEYLLNIAAHNLVDKKTGLKISSADEEVLHIAATLQGAMKRIRQGEYPLQLRQLRSILISYGCQFDEHLRRGNKIKIICGSVQTLIHSEGDGREVDTETIHRVRKELHLDAAHGCDSDIFYNRGPRIPEFINKYRQVLKRLAKV